MNGHVTPASGAIEPLVIRGKPGHLQTLAMIYQTGNFVRFAFASDAHERLPRLPENARGFVVGRGVHYEPGKRLAMTVVLDPYNGHIQVDVDHRLAARIFQPELTPEQNSAFIFPTDTVAFGRNDVGAPTLPAFTGSLVRRPTPRPPLCRTLGVK